MRVVDVVATILRGGGVVPASPPHRTPAFERRIWCCGPGTNARYVNPCDPSHGTPPTATKIKDNMAGFVSYENGIGHGTKQLNYCDVMSSFAPSELPIVTTLAEEYAIMDRMFCSHAGPTWSVIAPL